MKSNMNRLIQFVLAISMFLGITNTHAQSEADTTVYLTDFIFTPREFTISVGQTVAFLNPWYEGHELWLKTSNVGRA